MLGPYVHNIDPIIGSVFGIYLWWYGLSYTLGFLQIHLFLRRARGRMGLTLSEAYSLTLVFSVGVLAGGRLVEVLFDEWPFYREHPGLIPALWLGGMASHGLLVGAAASTWLFCWRYRKCFLSVADELVIPGAVLLGIGRLGNFIDGQIVGRVTDAWWGVQFPYADGFRHPVVLYDGLKNLLLIPLLLLIRRLRPAPGFVAASFVFWYAFLRIFVDLFRDYPTHRLDLGTGQTLNILMTLLGAGLLVWSRFKPLAFRRSAPAPSFTVAPAPGRFHLALKRAAVALLLLFSLTLPGNWTQDIPARYGQRHPGLRHSRLYPHIDTAPPGRLSSSTSREEGSPQPSDSAGTVSLEKSR